MSTHLISAAGMVAETVIKPLQPQGEGVPECWQQLPVNFALPPGCVMEHWLHRAGFRVLSAVEPVEEAGVKRLDYHISISRDGRRCTGNEAKHVLKFFGLEGWEEDNHVPGGIVRNFWRPVVENEVGHECPCKATENAMREDKGDYIWRE